MPRKKTSLAKFKKMTSDQIKSLNRKQAQELLSDMRAEYTKRAQNLEKYVGKGTFYSPAYEGRRGIKHWYEEKNSQLKSPSRTKILDAKAELERLSKFFGSKTSTVKGSRQAMIEQDKRIFGEDEQGNPKSRLRKGEREKFWEVYNEYKNSSVYESRYWQMYGGVKDTLGNIILSHRKRGDKDMNMQELLDELDNELKRQQYEYDELGTVSGSWDDFYS